MLCKVKKDVKYVSSSLARFLAGREVNLKPEPEYIPALDDYCFHLIQSELGVKCICGKFLAPSDTESEEILSSLPQTQSK